MEKIGFELIILTSRLMVIVAWLLTLVFTSPQAVIFRVLRHPMAEFYQCTTWGFFENFATEVKFKKEYCMY